MSSWMEQPKVTLVGFRTGPRYLAPSIRCSKGGRVQSMPRTETTV